MTRNVHDQKPIQCLKKLLDPLGKVETNWEVPGEVQEIDVYFLPSQALATNGQSLGLLGKLATTPAMFEPFRNPVTQFEVLSCIGKLAQVHDQVFRQAKRANAQVRVTELPRLWILSPTASEEFLESFNFQPDLVNYPKGIYFLGKSLYTAIVAIDQLPVTPETLWLRILGRGRVQQQAIEELKSLPSGSQYKDNILELVYDMLAILEARIKQNQDLEEDERELIMQLSQIYQQRLELATELGKQEGLVQGKQNERRSMVTYLLRSRFGELDQEMLGIIEPLMVLSPEEFTPLLLQLSRLELLTRFGERT
ncbi:MULTISPECIES: hypothetical protein [Moorena]|uniref:DUF4351 domain-containing protein n=1 Tax=Moorena producens 3L TaxID=489825 RepID=F4XM26_9CYAN|nr:MULTISPECIES: hypothetical protein [Moorena]EGJ34375.1 hypothetical protein LYNGBM3L_18150 [Moorena producens 3L]NEP64010.1 hypothetical protein [Moorena sp. SIO3A5]NES41610.1 hypothetical protein [Moorena sp. SIO2C4]OLT65577.1 hypothetical protein BI334_11540 [Moorena producens 3L]